MIKYNIVSHELRRHNRSPPLKPEQLACPGTTMRDARKTMNIRYE